VVCSQVTRDATAISDPVVIVEVLGDSTARTDLLVKDQEYAAIPPVHPPSAACR
jgi:hypothetical protein